MSDSRLGSYIALGLIIGIIVGLAVSPYISQAFNIPLVRPITLTKTVTNTTTITSTTTSVKTSTISTTITNIIEKHITKVLTTTKTKTEYVTLTATSTRYVTTTFYFTLTTTPYTVKIIAVDLHFKDHRPLVGTPSLLVTGYLVNAGNRPAYRVIIEVTFYQGNVKTIKDIIVGDIYPGKWVKIDTSIPYTGPAITRVEYTIKWS